MEDIYLCRLVHGQSLNNIFKVNIKPNNDVSDLKEAIKNKNRNDFADIDAHKLTLWRVSISSDDDNELKGLKLENNHDKGIKMMKPLERISLAFSDNPTENHIHVIVQPPVTG